MALMIAGFPKKSLTASKKQCKEEKMEIRSEYLDSGEYRFQTGYKATMQFMQLANPPDAIVAANNVIAIGFKNRQMIYGTKLIIRKSTQEFAPLILEQ